MGATRSKRLKGHKKSECRKFKADLFAGKCDASGARLGKGGKPQAGLTDGRVPSEIAASETNASSVASNISASMSSNIKSRNNKSKRAHKLEYQYQARAYED